MRHCTQPDYEHAQLVRCQKLAQHAAIDAKPSGSRVRAEALDDAYRAQSCSRNASAQSATQRATEIKTGAKRRATDTNEKKSTRAETEFVRAVSDSAHAQASLGAAPCYKSKTATACIESCPDSAQSAARGESGELAIGPACDSAAWARRHALIYKSGERVL
jgi:hypothetical protein